MAEDVVIAEVRKNATELVRVSLTQFRGHELCDLRVYFEQTTGSGEWLPTKKGVTFQRALLPDVIAALQDAQEATTA